MSDVDFTEEQKHYLSGFAVGSGMTATLSLPVVEAARPVEPGSAGPDALQRAAQDQFLAQGKKLATEEQAKRNKSGLDLWDEVVQHARDNRYPKGTDVFLFKFQGLFYVAPAQDSFMCRLRFPAGLISSGQMRGLAKLADAHGNGTSDATTRANLQLRQITASQTVDLLMGLHDLGIINRGSGADNIRNITASPTAGFDPRELIDTRPLARQMHHHILNHRHMYGLPRKFNIAFDGGGTISALEDTNDIGFVAVMVDDKVMFRMQLGGITGHKDFASDCGILLAPEECVTVAAAVVDVFIDHGDRTDRKKARLKYVLDAWGHEKFVNEVERRLPFKFRRAPLAAAAPPRETDRTAHIGFHPQKQEGLCYVGVALPVGRMTTAQMRGLADISDRFGSGDIRLTVWQNLLITDIPVDQQSAVRQAVDALGLHTSATHVRAGLIACTGNAGCKFAASNTKAHAMLIAQHLESKLTMDQPINIHVTGCHNSCAQHFIADVGLIATKVTVGEDMVEGYHVCIGGGYGREQRIAMEVKRDVIATDCPVLIEKILSAYQSNRVGDSESFAAFATRMSVSDIQQLAQI